MRALRDGTEHPKLLTCLPREDACISPFYAFLCRDQATADQAIRALPGEVPQHWSRIECFHPTLAPEGGEECRELAVLCFTEPVRRQPEICLSHLLDRELLSRLVVALQIETNSAATIFEGWVPETWDSVVWRPIEGFSRPKKVAPPRYNPFCELCREAASAALDNIENDLVAHCPRRSAERSECGKYGCRPTEFDRLRCPMFLRQRVDASPCGRSDQAAIDNVISCWTNGDHREYYETRCWAGFRQFAVPIVVFSHLLAVGLTGQFLLPEDTLPDRAMLAEDYPTLLQPAYRGRLARCLTGMKLACRRADAGGRPGAAWSSVLIEENDLRQRAAIFARSIRSIARLAERLYDDERLRAEHLFANFLFRRLAPRASSATPGELVAELLPEMARFWAVHSAFFLQGGDLEDGFRLVASTAGATPDVEQEELLVPKLRFSTEPRHVHARADRSDDAEELAVLDLAQRLTGQFGVRSALAVLVPVGVRRAVFLFVDRTAKHASRLPHRSQPDEDVPEFTRWMMLDTCAMVAECLRETWHLEDVRENETVIGHEIRSALALIRQPLGRLRALADGAYHDPAQRTVARGLIEQSRRVCQDARTGLDAALLSVERLRYQLGLTSTAVAVVGVDLVELVESKRRFFEYRWRGPTGGDALPTAAGWQADLSRVSKRYVSAEQTLLDLAVNNLLDNAFKYSFPGRVVDITAWTDEHASENVLQIANYGPVIEDDEVYRIGQRGFRGRQARCRKAVGSEGTGLGVYIVKQIIGRFGGSFGITSDVERHRTVACIRLPLWRVADGKAD